MTAGCGLGERRCVEIGDTLTVGSFVCSTGGLDGLLLNEELTISLMKGG